MGRKHFMDDLATAQVLKFQDISSIRSGEDGEFSFVYRSGNNKSARITAMIPDVSEYPKSHEYMLFASDDAPPSIAKAVENAPNTRRKDIPQLLETLSTHFKKASSGKCREDPMTIDDTGDTHMPDTSDFDDEDDFDFSDDLVNEDWAMDDSFETEPATPHPSRRNFSGESKQAVPDRIRNDLLSAKAAGFKVGALGYLQAGNSCYISISCRIEKLGISEDSMQAWSLEPSHYLCLILYFPTGYQDLQQLTGMDKSQARQSVEYRVGTCDTYKPPTLKDAQALFKGEAVHQKRDLLSDKRRLKPTFITGPLNSLLDERLITIVNLRLSEDLSWWGAEQYYNDLMGKHLPGKASRAKKNYRKADHVRTAYPSLVMEDELTSVKKTSQLSFPLIAMQFMLRHFVRCTEFCLVCHTRIETQIEAIKPYVCDKPLCLYQYMNLGFGPSIEHEILSQPFVVDILVSFCYASALSVRLRDYPSGLGWMVPHPQAAINGRREDIQNIGPYMGGRFAGVGGPVPPGMPGAMFGGPRGEAASQIDAPRTWKAKLNRDEMQLLFDKCDSCPLVAADWVVINFGGADPYSWHVRVSEVMYPTVSLSKADPLLGTNQDPELVRKENIKTGSSAKWESIQFHRYEINFDDLSRNDKAKSMILLMDLMPSVREMSEYLYNNHHSSISNWHARMTPASIGLLRWIIASNRSCIMQADEEIPQFNEPEMLKLGVKKGEQRIGGIGGWLQFRFAMGAPDKEQRFINSLSNGDSSYPSLFAWHGSPLYNWHGIVREGLNFNEVQHGRASGNGCYHAPEFMTSMGYSGGYAVPGRPGYTSPSAWPSSVLKLSSAIALNEIVNAPGKFTSQSPHYVVQYVDWIQTRYLFIQPSTKVSTASDVQLGDNEILPQDPHRIPRGPGGSLTLPITTVSKVRRPNAGRNIAALPKSSKDKKNKFAVTAGNLASLAKGEKSKSKGTRHDPIDLDTASVSTLDEDRELLSEQRPARPPTPPPSIPQTPVTSFTPRHAANIPLMPPPAYATSKATKTLQKSYMDLLKTQNLHIKNKNLQDLGWYLDEEYLEKSNNLYTWIVQMHSFPLDIPLGQDMKQADVQSIDFEVRFSANFPFSPPFVRVVRPRFLPFQMGGGGHVTAGGSICMDLLTTSGWTAVASIESVLLQIRMALMSTDPRPARLQCVGSFRGGPFMPPHLGGFPAGQPSKKKGGMDVGEYGVGEAVDAFIRACRVHQWEVPAELQQMTGISGVGYPPF